MGFEAHYVRGTLKVPRTFAVTRLSLRAQRSGAKQSIKFQQTSFLCFVQKFKIYEHLKDKLSAGTGQIASLRSAPFAMTALFWVLIFSANV